MARCLPQLEVVHVGRDDLTVVARKVLLADDVAEPIVDAAAVGQEEARARREIVKEEELLLDAKLAVVALRSLLLQDLILFEHLLVREGDAVDALELIVALLAQPQRRRCLHCLERLHLPRVGEVRALAQVDKGPTSVDGRRGAVGQLAGDHGLLERVGFEELQAVLLGDHHALVRLLRVRNLLRLLLERGDHACVDRVRAHVRVVEESVLRGRTVREFRAVETLERLAQDVRRRVPEDLLATVVIKLDQLQLTVALQRPRQIPQLKVTRGLALALIAIGIERHRDHALLDALEPLRVAHARSAARLRQTL